MTKKQFKNKVKALTSKFSIEYTMPIIPTLDDYSELYNKVQRSITDYAAEVSAKEQQLETERKLLNKYAGHICKVNFENVETIEEKEEVLAKAYKYLSNCTEKLYVK